MTMATDTPTSTVIRKNVVSKVDSRIWKSQNQRKNEGIEAAAIEAVIRYARIDSTVVSFNYHLDV
jgi:hypothetical protein